MNLTFYSLPPHLIPLGHHFCVVRSIVIPFEPALFYTEVLEANQITSAFGVPDSCLSGLSYYFSATKSAPHHIVTANEGAAVALSAGYYLSTSKLVLAYMQNSGLSNALNPFQSLAVKEVYGIPMLLLIGWRGKPGIPDEPQYALVGPRLLDILAANCIPYHELPSSIADAKETVRRLIEIAVKKHSPVALVVPPKTFREYKGSSKTTVHISVSPACCGQSEWKAMLRKWLSAHERSRDPLYPEPDQPQRHDSVVSWRQQSRVVHGA